MFWKNSAFTESYFNFFKNWFKFEKTIKVLPVDFARPWWQVIWDQKWTFGLEIFSEIIQQIYLSLTPIILGYIIFNRDYLVLFWYIFGYIFLEIFNRWVLKKHIIFILQASQSIGFYAYKFFLTVDPIYHTTKSTGRIISKIQGATGDLNEFLQTFTGRIIPAIVGYITVVFVLWNSDWRLGSVALFFFLLITFINLSFSFLSSSTFKPKVSKVIDDFNGTATENLFQNALIRSSFATTEQLHKTSEKIKKVMVYRAIAGNGGGINITITRLFYILSVLIIAMISLDLIHKNFLQSNTVIVLLITYINGTNGILNLGKAVQSMTEMYSRITDLFEYIRGFGKQSFPVVGD